MSDLVVTLAGTAVSFPMGQAAMSGDTFTGTHAYQSAGCGLAAVQTTGRFAGNLINLQAVITPANCAQSRFVGELSR